MNASLVLKLMPLEPRHLRGRSKDSNARRKTRYRSSLQAVSLAVWTLLEDNGADLGQCGDARPGTVSLCSTRPEPQGNNGSATRPAARLGVRLREAPKPP